MAMSNPLDPFYVPLYAPLMWCSEAYSNALKIQRLIAEEAQEPGLDKKLRPAFSRAFVELEMLKLRLRMRPAPKPIDVTIKPKPGKSHARAFSEAPEVAKVTKKPMSNPPATGVDG